jgi:hypothetical protein
MDEILILSESGPVWSMEEVACLIKVRTPRFEFSVESNQMKPEQIFPKKSVNQEMSGGFKGERTRR